jgi:hypothetical protein
MKNSNQLRIWMAALLAALLLLCLIPLGNAQLGQAGKVKGFKWPEFYDPIPGKIPLNRLKYLVTGAEAEPLTQDLIIVRQMQLESYQPDGRTNATAKAPLCLVDRENRQLTSTGRLEMLTGDGRLFLEGNQGFLCQMTNFNLIVSNHVRTIIRHAGFSKAKL